VSELGFAIKSGEFRFEGARNPELSEERDAVDAADALWQLWSQRFGTKKSFICI